MSSTASRRLEKYEPLDTRDFVPFKDYEELNLENTKEACEGCHNASAGSCYLLASDRGPLCSNRSKVAKYSSPYFLSQKRMPIAYFGAPEASFEHTPARPKSAPDTPLRVTTPTVVPKSVSIAQLLRAGALVEPLEKKTLYNCNILM